MVFGYAGKSIVVAENYPARRWRLRLLASYLAQKAPRYEILQMQYATFSGETDYTL